MSIMDEIMSTTPTTTTTTPDIVDELINYYVVNTPKCNSIIIKPLGAFKESPYFVAMITGFSKVGGPLSLRILSDNIFDNDNLNSMFGIFYVELICSDLKKAINEAVNILREITFCKVDGNFKRPNEKTKGQLYDIFSRLWDMQVDIECCVCKEITTTKTACGHRLCLICWSNINGIAEKDNNKKPRCPMCRGNIRYKEKWVDDEEYNSDNSDY